jgi:hypothetical protein
MNKQQSPLRIGDTSPDDAVVHLRCECGRWNEIEGAKGHFRCECGKYMPITVSTLSENNNSNNKSSKHA